MAQVRLALTSDPLDVAGLTAAVTAAAPLPSGGITSFIGVVRAENLGRRVRFLEYEAHEPLAIRAFERIDAEIHDRWPDTTLGLHHRLDGWELARRASRSSRPRPIAERRSRRAATPSSG